MTIRSHGYGLMRRMLFGAAVILVAVAVFTILFVAGVNTVNETYSWRGPLCAPGEVAIEYAGTVWCWKIGN